MVPGVSVCGSIRRMDSSISSGSHRIKDTAMQHRPEMQEPKLVPGVCLYVAAFVARTVV